jgi:hypothetical protein
MKSGMPCKYFIMNPSYDHSVFYLHWTWRPDMFDARNFDIFMNEYILPNRNQPAWNTSNLHDVDEYCLHMVQSILPTITLPHQQRPVYVIRVFKYSGHGTWASLKKYLNNKWALLNRKHDDMEKRVLAQLILRGDYEIWNAL